MKRSEMIKKLTSTYIDNIDEVGYGKGIDDFCEIILRTCEKAGMLPPSQYDIPHHDSLYKWEPEDDQ